MNLAHPLFTASASKHFIYTPALHQTSFFSAPFGDGQAVGRIENLQTLSIYHTLALTYLPRRLSEFPQN